MKYFRLMGINELQKILRKEILDRKDQKIWFLEKSYFYFVAEEDGGLDKLREIIPFFLNEEEPELFIIEFESNQILEKVWNDEEEAYESICSSYSINDMNPIGFIRSGKHFFFDEWIYMSIQEGIPNIAIRGNTLKNDLSKSFNDRYYTPNKQQIKKICLNRRKDRLMKRAIRWEV